MASQAMVAPLIPTRRLINSRDHPAWFLEADCFKQAKPYNVISPYVGVMAGVTSLRTWGTSTGAGWNKAGASALYTDWGDARARTLNKAYGNLIDAIRGDTAGWGINLAQWKQAEGMIAARAGQLVNLIRQAKRGNWQAVHRAISGSTPRGGYPKYYKPKKAASLFLEAHFGWEPLVKDIATSVDILARDPPYERVNGRGKEDVEWSDPALNYWADNGFRRKLKGTVFSKQGADVRIVNPNAFLAQSMGLVNFGQIAWDAVPWSFVVGWFVNVDQWLGSWTDLYGTDVARAYSTTTMKSTSSIESFSNYGLNGFVGTYWCNKMQRSTGLTLPTLQVNFKRFSPVRAATAISLLVGMLPGR